MTTNPTNAQIRSLRDESIAAGDTKMADICALALGDRTGWRCRCEIGESRARYFEVRRSEDGYLVDPVATYVYAPYAWVSAVAQARWRCEQVIRDAAAKAD